MSSQKTERKRTKFTGVYTRESATKRHLGRPDVCFDITYKADGRKVWEKVGWKGEGYTAQLASQVRSERIRQARNGDLVDTRQGLTFGQAWDLYDHDYLPSIANASTDRGLYKNHIQDRFHHIPLSQITPRDLEIFRDERLSSGLSPQSVKHLLALIRRVYRKMQTWRKWSGSVPTTEIQMPTVNNERFRYLTREEAAIVLTSVKLRSIRTWRHCILGLYAGMRAGEIFALRGHTVNLQSKTIHILDAKGGKSREVPMCEIVVEMFNEMGRLPSGLVFPSRTGGKSTRISQVFRRTVEQLGLNDGIDDPRGRIVFHSTRHTFASWLAIDGIPLYVIGDLMGHSSETMTRRYAHLCPDLRRKAVQSLVSSIAGHEF